MIGTVDCNVQAKYPSMPLDPMQAYVGSPSSIRVRNVPKRIGDWCIRNVQFVAVYPDASIKTAECKLVGCVWVGTIEGTQTSGKVQNGYSIFASGTDENGNEVSGYCLGKGDVEILEADGTIDPGTTSYYMHLLSGESESPKAGDMWLSGDAINIVDTDGTTKTFEQPELSGYATKDELSAKQDKISADGILSCDGQGNVTSADMSQFVKQNGSPVFNGLTALGVNYIEGYATTTQLKDGLTGKADLSSLSDYYTKTEVDTALSGKADKYPFTTILDDSGAINLRDAEVQKYTAAAQQALSVYPPSGTSTTARDLVFVLDCAANSVSVNVQWANNIHPHTDASTDLSVMSNAVNVYYLNEYASGQFVIAGWQETAGGNT